MKTGLVMKANIFFFRESVISFHWLNRWCGLPSSLHMYDNESMNNYDLFEKHNFSVRSWHDDVIKWKHLPRYWPFVRGIHRGPVTRSFDIFFDLRPNKWLSKQSWSWLFEFETPSHPLWRHCNEIIPSTKILLSQLMTSTLYWCIASKLKAPQNLYWMSNMFLWVQIFIFFVFYHVVPKRHSQLYYELMVCKTKRNLKRPYEGGVFWKHLLWLWVWSRLTNWHSSTSDSSGMSVLITESIYWTETSRVSQLISWGIFSIQKKYVVTR